MQTRFSGCALMCVALLTGCRDLATAPLTGPAPAARRSDASYGDPPAPGLIKIREHSADVVMPFESVTFPAPATIHTTMLYDAYHGKVDISVMVRDATGTTQKTFPTHEEYHWSFFSNYMQYDVPLMVMKNCGTVIEADVQYEVWWQGLAAGSIELKFLRAVAEDYPNGTQRTCDCPSSGSTAFQAVVYEPGYDPFRGGTDANCGSGGSDSGTGRQYAPGDMTGGETVDWGTGMGNGGTSVCGANAIVDYVCLDYWDGNVWVEWGCGFVTTC